MSKTLFGLLTGIFVTAYLRALRQDFVGYEAWVAKLTPEAWHDIPWIYWILPICFALFALASKHYDIIYENKYVSWLIRHPWFVMFALYLLPYEIWD